MHKKCPYLSTRLECFAGSFGTARCFDHNFHSNCEFKIAADNKGNPGRADKADKINVNNKVKDSDIEKNISHFFARFMK